MTTSTMTPRKPKARQIHDIVRENVRELMREQKITQRDLSKKSGVHFTQVSRYLCGHVDLTLQSIASLAEALGVSADQLVADG